MEQPRKKLIHKLSYKYRLVLINDASFEEKFSIKLTPMNVFVAFSSAIVLLTAIIITLIFYTSLREFVPGYTDTKTKRNLQQLLYKTDSLEQTLRAKELYYNNIINIMKGGNGLQDSTIAPGKPTSLYIIPAAGFSRFEPKPMESVYKKDLKA